MIQTTRLTKRYGRARGIDNLSIQVNPGDIYGFIGSNGAGKSTTIRLLLGFIRPSGGSAKVLGLDIIKRKNDILAGVGYVPSEISYYPGMRGLDAARACMKPILASASTAAATRARASGQSSTGTTLTLEASAQSAATDAL